MSKYFQGKANFTWLLFALIFLFCSDAILAQFDLGEAQRLVNLTLMLTIVAAVWAVDTSHERWANWKIGMSFIIVSLMIGDSIVETNSLAIYQLSCCFVFLSFSLFLCWKQVMFRGTVSGNQIIGAICIYMLMGVIWAFAYLIVELLFPGSFSNLGEEVWQRNLGDLLYYSMVTLTTLGYGDITPQQPVARFLAYMEAIIGIFYTTVLVASLIGMRLARYSESLLQQDDDSASANSDKDPAADS